LVQDGEQQQNRPADSLAGCQVVNYKVDEHHMFLRAASPAMCAADNEIAIMVGRAATSRLQLSTLEKPVIANA